MNLRPRRSLRGILSHLQQPVETFAKDILKPCFGATSPTGKYFVDVREILLLRGVPDDYTYEPYMSKGRICLEELVYSAHLSQIFTDHFISTRSKIAGIFNNALHPVEKFIDAQLRSAKHQKIEVSRKRSLL